MAKRMFVPATNNAKGIEIIALETSKYDFVLTDEIDDRGIVHNIPVLKEERQIHGFAVVAHWGEPGISATVVPLSISQFKLLVKELIVCEHPLHNPDGFREFEVGDLRFTLLISDDFLCPRRGEMRIFFPHHPAHSFDLVVIRTSALKAGLFGPRPTGPTGRIFFEALRPGRIMDIYRYGQKVAQYVVTSYPFWDDAHDHWSLRAMDSQMGEFGLDLVACGIIPSLNGEWSRDSYCIAE